MLKLLICIINWNTKELLEGCLTSLKAQKKKHKFSIAIVDNASEDDSAEMVEKKFPSCFLIKHKENKGMAYGLNHILKHYKAEYYLFLHPDTKMEQDCIDKMITYLDDHPEVAVTGCKVVYPNGLPFASFHRFPTLRALAYEGLPTNIARALGLHGLYLRSKDNDKEQEVDIIASCCFFIRKKSLDYIGLLDDRFGNWMAEWDLCYRLKQGHWKIKYVPIATVVHYEGQAVIDGEKLQYKKYSYVIADKMLNSLFLFYHKHYSWFSLVVLKGATVIGLGVKMTLYAPLFFASKEARERIRYYAGTIWELVQW